MDNSEFLHRNNFSSFHLTSGDISALRIQCSIIILTKGFKGNYNFIDRCKDVYDFIRFARFFKFIFASFAVTSSSDLAN